VAGGPDRGRGERFLGTRDKREKAKPKAPPSNTEDGAPKIILGFSVRATRPPTRSG